MTDEPKKKRRKLMSALREAIGAHASKTEENIEKPIALALISDNASANDLLNKIFASRRPQAILEVTLKICEEKKSEAHVEEAFLSIFRKHFSVLGIESALSCWKLIEEHLNKSESINEILIACEFIATANLLGHGFNKLFQTIRASLPLVIQNVWKQDRHVDALTLSYSFVSLLMAESIYGDDQSSSQCPSEYWNAEVLTEKSMKKDFGMRMVSALAGNDGSLKDNVKIKADQLDVLSKVLLNHLEFYVHVLDESVVIQFLTKVVSDHLDNNQLMSLAARIRSTEVFMTPSVYYALISVIKSSMGLADSDIFSIHNLEALRLKDVTKQLPLVCEVSVQKSLNGKAIIKLKNLLGFIQSVSNHSEEDNYLAAFSLLVINLFVIFDDSVSESCKTILKSYPIDVVEKLVKSAKGLDGKVPKLLKALKKTAEEDNATSKFVNRPAIEVIEGLGAEEVTPDVAISLLKGVHTTDTRAEVFDAVVNYVEDLPGGECLEEIELYKLIVEMYGGTPLETLALQLVFSRLAADGWTDMDRAPGTEQSEESWFTLLVGVIVLFDTCIKSAKNSILKSYTALFCQLFSQTLKNTQKFARHSSNAILSQTLSLESTRLCFLRRHKLIQDAARLVEAMKRNESYFAMLTASMIGDAVFYGSDSLLVMSKLHSLADKNAAALLATNLPAVERTRYKKFLSTITRASKRVY